MTTHLEGLEKLTIPQYREFISLREFIFSVYTKMWIESMSAQGDEDYISLIIKVEGTNHPYIENFNNDLFKIAEQKTTQGSVFTSSITYGPINVKKIKEYTDKIINFHKTLNSVKKYNL